MCTEELKPCTKCKSVFYCCRTCKKKDWKARHGVLCIARRNQDEWIKGTGETEASGSRGVEET